MAFLKIMPYFTSTNAEYYKDFKYIAEYVSGDITIDKQALDVLNNSTPIELKVMDSPEVTRELNKKKVKLYNSNGASSFKYYYDGDAGYSFKVKCLVSKNDKLRDGKSVYYYLNKLYTNCINTVWYYFCINNHTNIYIISIKLVKIIINTFTIS